MVAAKLILENGFTLSGECAGAETSVSGEIGELNISQSYFSLNVEKFISKTVFQTGMVGYVESLTDPSYHRQILTLTYPLIGNYGVPPNDSHAVDENGILKFLESDKVWASALVVDKICEQPSHWNSVESLSNFLRKHNVPILYNIDTRKLTKIIRENGTMKGKIIVANDDPEKLPFIDINQLNLVDEVSTKIPKHYGEKEWEKILVVDCGMKNNQIRCLLRREVQVTIIPWNTDFCKMDFDGLFLSNGPGDPQTCSVLIDNLKKFMARNTKRKPIMGICLGNQVLASAAGASTYKLKYGNRGHNQPCTHEDTGRCFITSQNHGFAVDPNTLSSDWAPLFTNANDNTNEGIIHHSFPYFSVQFHPEHTAGPADLELLFDVFVSAVKDFKANQNKKEADRKEINIRHRINELFRHDSLRREQLLAKPKPKKVILLGSGGLQIGQAGEFDYSGS
uniref:Carbamoyl phosphate synthase arginine-specific small chain n=1 Tax=Romanomermis culicivorax TaxID=13658 RepID=A0A915HW31_ROMCU